MVKYRKTGLILILNLLALCVRAQDAYFSQFHANRLYLNPSLAGIEEESRRMYIGYRNQWPSMDQAYVTYTASYDQYLEPLKGGLGIMISNDVQGNGNLQQFSFSGYYSYRFFLSRQLSVSTGMQASFVQRKLNTSDFVMEDPGDGMLLKKDFPDFGTGFSVFYQNFYGGAAIFHLLKPRQTESNDPEGRLNRKIMLYWGGMFPVYEKRLGKEVLQLSPNLVFSHQKNSSQINYGLEALLNDQYLTGLWLRQDLGIRINSLIVSVGYTAKSFRFRYSYDIFLSSPKVNLPGMYSHEISLILTPDYVKKIKREAIKCPKI